MLPNRIRNTLSLFADIHGAVQFLGVLLLLGAFLVGGVITTRAVSFISDLLPWIVSVAIIVVGAVLLTALVIVFTATIVRRESRMADEKLRHERMLNLELPDPQEVERFAECLELIQECRRLMRMDSGERPGDVDHALRDLTDRFRDLGIELPSKLPTIDNGAPIVWTYYLATMESFARDRDLRNAYLLSRFVTINLSLDDG